MKEIVIDGNNFSNLEEFYDEMDRLLTRPLFKSGHNLDAFDDLLWGGFGFHDIREELNITWIHAAKSRRDLGFEETARYLEHQLTYCHPDFYEEVTQQLAHVRNHTGETLFDTIVDIIDRHNHSRHGAPHKCALTIID